MAARPRPRPELEACAAQPAPKPAPHPDPVSVLLGQLIKGQEIVEGAITEMRLELRRVGGDVASMTTTMAQFAGSVVTLRENVDRRIANLEKETAAAATRLDGFDNKESFARGAGWALNMTAAKAAGLIAALAALIGAIATAWKFLG